MSEEKTLTATEQKTILFLNDELIAIRAANDGQVYASLAHMCDALGLRTPSQVRRIKRHVVLLDGYQKGAIETAGGLQKVGLLRVDLVPLWLSGLDVNRVKDDIKEKITDYQKRAAQVLWEAFQEGRLTADSSIEALLESDTPAAQTYKMLQAMLQLARNQLMLESRLDEHDQTLQNYGQRIEEIEASLSEKERHITREQASRISQAVRAVGLVLTKQSGSSEYGRVYGELYRKFEISAYRELPAHRYDEAMSWLNEWRQSLVDDVPF